MHLQDLKHEHAVAMHIPQDYINAAIGSGISFQALLELVLTYGLPYLSYLAHKYGWNLSPVQLPPVPALPQAPTQMARPQP